MAFWSCHTCFISSSRGIKPHKVIADMDALPTFAAGLVRDFHIDRLYNLTQGVSSYKSAYLCVFWINCSKFSICRFCTSISCCKVCTSIFRCALLVLMDLAYHSKAFIRNLLRYIVLVEPDKQAVKLGQALFSLSRGMRYGCSLELVLLLDFLLLPNYT